MRELGLPQGPSLAVNQVCGGMGFFFGVDKRASSECESGWRFYGG